MSIDSGGLLPLCHLLIEAGVASPSLGKPPVTSGGGVYTTALPGEYQYEHTYAFTPSSEEEGTYAVAVYDRAANRTEVAFIVRRDTAPPESTASSPAYDNSGSIPVTWTAQDSEADDVSGLAETVLWYKFNAGGTWAATAYTSSADFSVFNFDPQGVNGTYYFATVSTDNVANREEGPSGEGKTHTIYDTAPPESEVTSAPTYANAGPIAIAWEAGDNLSGVDEVALWVRVPGGSWAAIGQTAGGSSGSFNYTPTAGDGTYHFATRARDRAGNWEAVPTGDGDDSTVYDTTPPQVRVAAQVQGSAIVVTWSATDAGSGLAACALEVREDEGAWQQLSTACAGSLTTGEPGHLYTFRVTATDHAGNAAGATAQTGVPRVTKYYYFNSVRVAMRTPDGVYYLHADHLGSLSLVTDHAAEVVAERRFLPYGDTRRQEGTLPTDFGFAGQRGVPGTGLVFMHARYYHPALGRFVSADTIVPEPGNPQDLNRYAYVRNNPLRYTDPAGYLSEDEIMAYFGVQTWEEVLAFFEAGGELEGKWGWLETLRTALLGDEIQFFENYSGFWPPPGPAPAKMVLRGKLVDLETQLYIQSGDILIPASEAVWLGSAYGVERHIGDSPLYLGPFYAERTYYHLKFDPSRVDWVGAGLDAAGIVADVVSLGTMGRLANVAKISRRTGDVLDVLSVVRSWPSFSVAAVTGELSFAEGADFGLDVAGLFVPVVPDAISLSVNLSQGVYYEP